MRFFILVALFLSLSSCVSSMNNVFYGKILNGQCVFTKEDSNEVAPKWLCESLPILYVSSVGRFSTAKSYSIGYKVQGSVMDARSKLYLNIQDDILPIIQKIALKYNVSDNFLSDLLFNPNNDFNLKTLSRTRIYKQTLSKSGTTYVLVGFTKQDFVKYVSDIISINYHVYPKEWEKILNKKSLDEFKKDFKKMI